MILNEFPTFPIYTYISQFGKQMDGNYIAQRVIVVPTNIQQQFKEVSSHDKTLLEQSTSSSLRDTIKEIPVGISRDSSPEKHHLRSSSDEDEQENKNVVLVDVS
jgi:hypothetical protein